MISTTLRPVAYRVSYASQCTFILPADSSDPNQETKGFVVLEVDDLLEAGTEEHEKKMKDLRKRFQFGKVSSLQELTKQCHAPSWL